MRSSRQYPWIEEFRWEHEDGESFRARQMSGSRYNPIYKVVKTSVYAKRVVSPIRLNSASPKDNLYAIFEKDRIASPKALEICAPSIDKDKDNILCRDLDYVLFVENDG